MTTELRRSSASGPPVPAELDRWLAASMGQSSRPAARRGRRRAAMLAGLVALGLVAGAGLGPRLRDTAVAPSFKLSNGTVIGVEEFMDAKHFARLRHSSPPPGRP